MVQSRGIVTSHIAVLLHQAETVDAAISTYVGTAANTITLSVNKLRRLCAVTNVPAQERDLLAVFFNVRSYEMKFFILIPLVLLTACQTFVDPNDKVAVADRINIIGDQYTGTKSVAAPPIKKSENMHHQTYFMIGERKGTEKMIAIVAEFNFWSWKHLDKAFYKGRSFEIARVGQKVGMCFRSGCKNIERVVIKIPSNMQNTIKNDPSFSIKIVGNGGSEILSFPKPYIEAFMDRYKEL